MYEKKIPHDFMIRFYDPSLFCIFRVVSKMYFWQPCSRPFSSQKNKTHEL
jgi:hypothetical protein